MVLSDCRLLYRFSATAVCVVVDCKSRSERLLSELENKYSDMTAIATLRHEGYFAQAMKKIILRFNL